MQTWLLVHQSMCTILVIAIGEEVQVYMWVYLGDVTDEKESTLKFLEKVKIAFVMIPRLECILLHQM